MTDTPVSVLPDRDANEAARNVPAAIDVLSRALRGRAVPPCRSLASGETASSEEGLALVQSFLAIRDPQARQAILHVAAALAGTPRG